MAITVTALFPNITLPNSNASSLCLFVFTSWEVLEERPPHRAQATVSRSNGLHLKCYEPKRMITSLIRIIKLGGRSCLGSMVNISSSPLGNLPDSHFVQFGWRELHSQLQQWAHLLNLSEPQATVQGLAGDPIRATEMLEWKSFYGYGEGGRHGMLRGFTS